MTARAPVLVAAGVAALLASGVSERADARRATGASAIPSVAPEGPGRLVVVGGSLDDDNDAVYRAVVEARHGEGPLCVLPTASGVPERSMASAVERLAREVGPGGVEGILVTEADPAEADTPELADRLRGCSGFWFTGGDQSRIVDVFLPDGRATAGYEALVERHAEGAVVAGSSAGAAMMTTRMIAGGSSAAALEHGVRDGAGGDGVRVRRGMGFLPGPVVDQHFLARGRVGRLLAAVLAGEGGGVGLGVDENTALVIDGPAARVVGESGVLLVDARGAAAAPASGSRRVVLRLLGPGDGLDLSTLEPREPVDRSPLTADGGPVAVPDEPFGRFAFLHLLADLAASPDTAVEMAVGGHRLRLSEGPGFRARADGPGGVDGTPRGFSAGPWVLEVQRRVAGASPR